MLFHPNNRFSLPWTQNIREKLVIYNRQVAGVLKATASKETQKQLRRHNNNGTAGEVRRAKYGCKRVRRRQHNSSRFILRCLFSFRAQNEMRLTSHNFSDNVFLRQRSIQSTLFLAQNRGVRITSTSGLLAPRIDLTICRRGIKSIMPKWKWRVCDQWVKLDRLFRIYGTDLWKTILKCQLQIWMKLFGISFL